MAAGAMRILSQTERASQILHFSRLISAVNVIRVERSRIDVRRNIYSSGFQSARDSVPCTITHEDLNNKERHVPFLFLPHTVKKAYVVHEVMTSMPNVFDKYKWLTKTVSTPELPVDYANITKEKYQDKVSIFHDSLQQTVAYQKAYKNKNLPRYLDERITHNIMSNFIRISMLINSGSNHLVSSYSFLYHEPLLATHWPRNYKFYQTKFRPTFILRTRQGLEQVEESEELTPDEVESIPGPYDTYAFNAYRQHIVHLQNRPAMDNSNFNPIKHAHTTIIVNSRLRTQEQFLACATFTSFAQLISQAQTLGSLHGTDMEKPLVTQCIVTNGHRICFMVYQLNTMCLIDDKGLWNRCWYSPVIDMFKRNEDKPSHLVFEEAQQGSRLENFDENICKYFLNFFGKDTLN